MQWVVVEVDADAAENADVKPELEPGEFIDVFLVEFRGLHETLMVSQHQQRCVSQVKTKLRCINCKVLFHVPSYRWPAIWAQLLQSHKC